jgi:arylformamidase
MITQCRTALHMLQGHYLPTSVTLSGSSAGAHLAAHTAIAAPLPLDLVVLLSGVYDLTPLVDTYVNDALGLSVATARECSVPFDVLPGAPVVVAHGDNETAAFIGQSAALAEAWDAERIEMPHRNHFDVVFDLALLDVPTRRAPARPAR